MYGSFVFDGKSSESFNLLVASFDNKGLYDASAGCQTNFETESNYNGSKWYAISNRYREPLELTIQLSKPVYPGKNMYFTTDEIRGILSWLCSPSDYKTFRIDNEFYYGMNFKVKFINPSYKIVGEKICGLELTILFERPFALSDDITCQKTFNGNGTITLYNHSDEFDKCLYPQKVTITALSGGTITLQNDTESNHILTKFQNCTSGEIIILNCEERIITSTHSSIIERFNKNWLRLSHGKNLFTVTGNCTIEFKYNEIRRVGAW